MTALSAIVSTEVAADQTIVFEHIVPIDLTSIFTGYGPLPRVTGTSNQIGAWDEAEQTRTVHLADGSTAQELLTKYEHPNYFSYTVRHFTGVLRFLALSANGEWWFTHAAGKTVVRWRYAFNPRSRVAVPVLWFIVAVFWRGYMHKALRLSIQGIGGQEV